MEIYCKSSHVNGCLIWKIKTCKKFEQRKHLKNVFCDINVGESATLRDYRSSESISIS